MDLTIVTTLYRSASYLEEFYGRACAADTEAWLGTSFSGRLDLDIDHGIFLCRRGHRIRVEREAARPAASDAAAA